MQDAALAFALLGLAWMIVGWPRRRRGEPNELTYIDHTDAAFTFTVREAMPIGTHLGMASAAIGLLIGLASGKHLVAVLGLMLANVLIAVRATLRYSRRRDPFHPSERVELRKRDEGIELARDGSITLAQSRPRIDVVSRTSGELTTLDDVPIGEVTSYAVLLTLGGLSVRVAEFVTRADAEQLVEQLGAWLGRDDAKVVHRRGRPPPRPSRAPVEQGMGTGDQVLVAVLILANVSVGGMMVWLLAKDWSATWAVGGYIGPALLMDGLLMGIASLLSLPE